MIKKIFIGAILSVAVMLVALPALAAEDFAEAKSLVDQKVSCDTLNQDQLEKIGDYVMEQMVSGSVHEQMDQMMGGEGSESLRQAHIFMARRWYCGDAAGFTMMGMMGGGYPYISGRSFGMMGGWGSMMNNWGMMNVGYYGWMSILYLLGIVFFVSGIAAFVKYLLKK